MNALPDTGGFRGFQTAFAARIRDSEAHPLPQGVPARRMQVYEELLFANLEGFLLACYPITHELLGERAWRATVRRYFAEHRSRSPLFRDIPGEFLAWMRTQTAGSFPERPFLCEFMHYEWLEQQVTISPETVEPPSQAPFSDLRHECPRLNPTAQLACYAYPVHRIGPGFEPDGPDGRHYCYLVYRDHQDVARFVELNPVSARLVELMVADGNTAHAALMQIAAELNHPCPEALVDQGRTLLEQLRRIGAVSRTWRTL